MGRADPPADRPGSSTSRRPGRALIVSNLDGPSRCRAGVPARRRQALLGQPDDRRESVRARLEAGGISYTEFSYKLLQANDFLELYRRLGCTLQLAGSDQYGNLVSGIDLIRRVEGDVRACARPPRC